MMDLPKIGDTIYVPVKIDHVASIEENGKEAIKGWNEKEEEEEEK